MGWVAAPRRRLLVLAGLLALLGITGATVLAGAARAQRLRAPSGCIPYRTQHIPSGTKCMIMPWELAQASPEARGVYVVLAPGCFHGYPSGSARQTRREIRIEVFARRPSIRDGRLQMGCGSATAVLLRSPIDGRRIIGAHWKSRLRFGSLSHIFGMVGLPRLLGLSPADARHALWLWGFRSQLSGRGREIVAQLPGWGLVGKRGRPNPYSGVTKLTAGARIDIPSRPVIPRGARTGILKGEIVGPVGGARLALFNARGRLLARFLVNANRHFRLRVTPGRYLFVADSDGWIACSPARVRVRPSRTAQVTVPVGCGIIY